MPLFRYSGFDDNGSSKRGELLADSLDGARRDLLGQGIYISTLSPTAALQNGAVGGLAWPDFSHYSVRDILALNIGPVRIPFALRVIFLRQFATLIDAGIQIVPALDALIESTTHAAFIRVLKSVRKDVNEGKTLAAAFTEHPAAFSPTLTSMVKAAEVTGKLGSTLVEQANLMEQRQKLVGTIRAALTYPLVMLVIGLLVVAYLVTAVVPQIAGLYADIKQTLPPATQFLLFLSSVLQTWGAFIFMACIAACAGFVWLWQRFENVRRMGQNLMLKLPVVGTIISQSTLIRFASTLGALLKSGVPVLQALQLAEQSISLISWRIALNKAATEVAEGKPLAQALADTKLFPPLLVSMVRIGEAAGRVPAMLETVARTQNDQLTATLSSMTALIQPLLLVIMGGLIAFIMMAVLMPIFDLNTTTF